MQHNATPILLSTAEIQRAALMQWFRNNWRVPRGDESTLNVELVQRKKLRAELNRVLVQLKLPPLSERSSVWTEWFLRDTLQLCGDEIGSGKPLRLVRVLNADGLLATLRYLMLQIEQQRQHRPSVTVTQAT